VGQDSGLPGVELKQSLDLKLSLDLKQASS
jgi:hypothetical protein